MLTYASYVNHLRTELTCNTCINQQTLYEFVLLLPLTIPYLQGTTNQISCSCRTTSCADCEVFALATTMRSNGAALRKYGKVKKKIAATIIATATITHALIIISLRFLGRLDLFELVSFAGFG